MGINIVIPQLFKITCIFLNQCTRRSLHKYFIQGTNPETIRNTKTGVFVGCSGSESHEAWSTDTEKIVGYEMTGCQRSMFANRISFTFDFKGPSYAIDTACSSSLLALDQAMLAIRAGQCDAAIVAGTSICLKPANSLQFQRLGMLASDGTCKAYDASG